MQVITQDNINKFIEKKSAEYNNNLQNNISPRNKFLTTDNVSLILKNILKNAVNAQIPKSNELINIEQANIEKTLDSNIFDKIMFYLQMLINEKLHNVYILYSVLLKQYKIKDSMVEFNKNTDLIADVNVRDKNSEQLPLNADIIIDLEKYLKVYFANSKTILIGKLTPFNIYKPNLNTEIKYNDFTDLLKIIEIINNDENDIYLKGVGVLNNKYIKEYDNLSANLKKRNYINNALINTINSIKASSSSAPIHNYFGPTSFNSASFNKSNITPEADVSKVKIIIFVIIIILLIALVAAGSYYLFKYKIFTSENYTNLNIFKHLFYNN